MVCLHSNETVTKTMIPNAFTVEIKSLSVDDRALEQRGLGSQMVAYYDRQFTGTSDCFCGTLINTAARNCDSQCA